MVKKDINLRELLLHEKPAKVIVAIKNSGSKTYASTVAKVIDCTYSHTVKILDVLKKAGLVAFEKKGRIKYIKLTDAGDGLASDLDNLLAKLNKIGKETKKK